jgi:16S rRNA (cytosine1402-N4)-methyltransferase
MQTTFNHTPVLLDAVLKHLAGPQVRTLVDCTLGGGGHALALLKACPQARLWAFDRDPRALQAAAETLKEEKHRVVFIHAPFSTLKQHLLQYGVPPVDALLADLGVSSHQLDTPERGFSFRFKGPLDMRMDTSSGLTLAEMLQEVDETTLADVIYTYGEERHSRKAARAILAQPLASTEELAKVVRGVVPMSKDRIDPATRTFQALRMWVNHEWDELEQLLKDVVDVLAPGGKAGVISFHSLEDRLVKTRFRQEASGCACPPSLPVCVCHKKPRVRIETSKPLVGTESEIRENPRARSAKVRIISKIH